MSTAIANGHISVPLAASFVSACLEAHNLSTQMVFHAASALVNHLLADAGQYAVAAQLAPSSGGPHF